jgi:hypothetical protein
MQSARYVPLFLLIFLGALPGRAWSLNWGNGLSGMGASLSDTAGALMQQELQRQQLEQQHQQQMQQIQLQHDLQMQQLQEQTRSTPIAQPTASSGTLTWPSGEKYVGEFKDGKPDGQGTLTSPTGQKYVGEWNDGKHNGQGTLTLPTGEKYVGKWNDGKRDGHGTNTWPTGQKYVGEWKDGERNGQGTFTWPTGQKYVPDGGKYVGEWKDDKPDGQGTQYAASGAIVRSGIFANGVTVSAASTNADTDWTKGLRWGLEKGQSAECDVPAMGGYQFRGLVARL